MIWPLSLWYAITWPLELETDCSMNSWKFENQSLFPPEISWWSTSDKYLSTPQPLQLKQNCLITATESEMQAESISDLTTHFIQSNSWQFGEMKKSIRKMKKDLREFAVAIPSASKRKPWFAMTMHSREWIENNPHAEFHAIYHECGDNNRCSYKPNEIPGNAS